MGSMGKQAGGAIRLLDLVVKPETYARLRETLRHEPLLLVEGIVQQGLEGTTGATSVLVASVQALRASPAERRPIPNA